MKFEGVGFNDKWVSQQTFDHFCHHEAHHGIPEDKLKEFWDACRQLHGVQDTETVFDE